MQQHPLLPLDIPVGTILDHTTEGIYVTDLDCRILFWNAAAERITGWKSEEVVGRPCSEDILMHVDHQGRRLCEPGRCPLHRSMTADESSGSPILLYANTPGGQRVPVSVSVAPLHDQEGKVVGGVEVFRDERENLLNLERARMVQRHVLPQDLPRGEVCFAALYRPLDQVGGDYYNVRTLNDGRHAFMLADVTGHGISAALNTMTLNALWHRYGRLLVEPGRFLTRLNQEVAQLFTGDNFATAVVGVVDPASGRLVYGSAGHPAPLWRHRDGEVGQLPALDPPLGMEENNRYHKDEVVLERGELLLLYSDGALEAENPQGEPFGMLRLVELVRRQKRPSPEDLLAGMEQALTGHRQSSLFQDDLTLLALARVAPPPA